MTWEQSAPEATVPEPAEELAEKVEKAAASGIRAEGPSIWEQVRRWLRPHREDQLQRVRELSVAIELHPDSPANYVLRGELYLELGVAHMAADDFATAIDLAAAQIEEERWGLVAQPMLDRAIRGLYNAQNRFAG